MVIPDGDRRHGSVSRDVVRKVQRSGEGYEHIVCVLVLCDNLFDGVYGLVGEAPAQDLLEGRMIANLSSQVGELSVVQVSSIGEGYWHATDLECAGA